MKMGSYFSRTVAPTPEVGEYVVSHINGFVRKDFEATEETNGFKRSFFGLPWKKPAGVPWSHIFAGFSRQEVKIYNARLMQEAWKGDKASFFDKHGFVLCKAPTKVVNWNEDYENEDTDITKIYHQEIETLIREEIFPEGTEFVTIEQANAVLKRGPNSNTGRFYASGAHQDYCLTPDQYKEALQAYGLGEEFTSKFDQTFANSDTFMTVCFWRPVEMEKPLLNNPLCVLDRSTLKAEDMVKTELYGFTPTGKPQPQLNIKYDEGQRWCYYPDMTCDEVLVFKQFCYQKSDPDAPYKCAFHSAFVDPRETYSNHQYRKSTEHRVGIFLN